MSSLNKIIYKHEIKHKQKISSKYPFIIRFDAKGTRLKQVDVWDNEYRKAMFQSSNHIMNIVGGLNKSKKHIVAYTQSDELNILCFPNNSIRSFLTNHKNDVQKIISTLSAEMALYFNQNYTQQTIIFDVKIFNLPSDLLQGYLIWRQKSALNFAYQNKAKEYLSYDERMYQNQDSLHRKMAFKGFDMNQYPTEYKLGFIIHNGFAYTMPEFNYNPVNEVSFARLIENIKGQRINFNEKTTLN